MNDTVDFERQYEEKPDVIEVGDYVRIVEDAEMYDDQDLIYLRDIQAVGVMRGELNTGDGWIAVEFQRGQFGFPRNELYLVNVDALPGEMEEMIAEEAAEQSENVRELNISEDAWLKAWNEYEANPTRDNAVAFIIANLRETVNEAEAEIEELQLRHNSVVEMYEARLNEHKTALEETFEANVKWEILHSRIGALLLPERNPSEVNVLDTLSALIAERDSLLARNRLLEERLTPFALAAEFDYDVQHSAANKSLRISSKQGHMDSILIGETGTLQVRHLNDALDALPELKPGSANAGDESA